MRPPSDVPKARQGSTSPEPSHPTSSNPGTDIAAVGSGGSPLIRALREGFTQQWGTYITNEIERVVLLRGKRNRCRFYNVDTGAQVGPEQTNVAPACAYALSLRWRDGATGMLPGWYK